MEKREVEKIDKVCLTLRMTLGALARRTAVVSRATRTCTPATLEPKRRPPRSCFAEEISTFREFSKRRNNGWHLPCRWLARFALIPFP
jgi:hypothetical protein